ncbi:MAG TPA: sigma-70 family RNA polymerase sigma factor [Polyangiaceae bacterium]|nr:sigma-70 family RNA polymerase sigma factor [Polyangiaceae bacterium]
MTDADEPLLAAIRAGDDQALSTLLSKHASSIYRFGLKMCGDPEDARDVMQETLLAAAKGVREFRGASSFLTWLYTVARSFCIKKRRASKFAPAQTISLNAQDVDPNIPAPGAGADEAASTRELQLALDRAFASLDPAQREVLILRDVEGLTAPEVAEVLGLSVEAVKSRLHRGRAQLRTLLQPVFSLDQRSEDTPASAGCPDVVTLFSQRTEGDISPSLCEAMERHVASCKRCTAACESLKHTLELCRADTSGSVPPEIQTLVRQAVRQVRRETP